MYLSVVIPTFNRHDVLRLCLRSIAAQRGVEPGEVEVLVLNDGGPSAEAAVRAETEAPGWPGFAWSYHQLSHRGPAAVRNEAARLARGEVLLILNDDVTLSPEHFAAHIAFHRRAAGDAGVPRHKGIPLAAGRGMTRWAADSVATPLMRWLVRQSFFYYLVTQPSDIGYEFYHTCDLSVPRLLLTELAPFDGSFPHASFEDTEWGWRLEKLGVRLALLPGAVTEHHHVYDESALARRAWVNGASAALLLLRVPELYRRAIGDFLRLRDLPGSALGGPGRRLMRMAAVTALASPLRGTAINTLERYLRTWAARGVPPQSGPARWEELTRRGHVAGFLAEYARQRGRLYRMGDRS